MSIPRSSSDDLIEVLVVASDLLTAHLLASDLGQHAEFCIAECTPDADSISSCLSTNSPSTLLMIGDESKDTVWEQLSLLRYVRSEYPGTRSVVLLDDTSHEVTAEVFRAGAKGIFSRSEYDAEILCRCIRCVSSGQIWANSEQLELVLDAFAEYRHPRLLNANGTQLLTRREDDVVRLVQEGMTNRQIAEELKLSEHTIRNNLFRIFDKLGVFTRVELALYAGHGSKRGPARALDPRKNKLESALSRTESASGVRIHRVR